MKKNLITADFLEKVLIVLEKEVQTNIQLKEKIVYVTRILTLMKQDNDCWFTLCPFNYGYIGKNFYEWLNRINNGDKEAFNDYFDIIFVLSIRFFREAMIGLERKYLFTYENMYNHLEITQLWKAFRDLPINYVTSTEAQNQLFYIKNELNFDILNHYLGGKDFQAMANFDENVQQAEKQVNELEKLVQTSRQELEYFIQETNDKADTKIKEVQRLETSLKTYKEGFNFVGLSSGFSNLLSKKEKNNKISFILLCIIGIIIILLPLINIGIYICTNAEFKDISWQQLLIGIGLEFVLIYFFRVILNQYRAVETQIMQLELRLSLCQFIQAYAEYAKEIKANDKDALEKFENLIFSSILSNDNNIPSTFDGMEQVTQLIKELKSKP